MPKIHFPAGVDPWEIPNEPKNWFRDAGECGNLLYRVKDWILMTAEADFLFSFKAASEFAKSAGWRLPSVAEISCRESWIVPEKFPWYVRHSKGLWSPGTEAAVWAVGEKGKPALVFWSEKSPLAPASVTDDADPEIRASVAVVFA